MSKVKKVILFLCMSVFCISLCAESANGVSVSTLLHANESSVYTDYLPNSTNEVDFYFTVGETSEYYVQFITYRFSQKGQGTPGEEQNYLFRPGISVDGTFSPTTGNYLKTGIFANGVNDLKSNCVAGALLSNTETDENLRIRERERIDNCVE
ncbi:MAG: hypothetical protein PUF12_08085 [Thermoflexaceae bacterium]|nr:hypothetical protein [Thermoflexaceae bacterium]